MFWTFWRTGESRPRNQNRSGMAERRIGKQQQYLLAELLAAGGWCEVEQTICGSNYGGKKKHLCMLFALEVRGLVEIQKSACGEQVQARALEAARGQLD